MNEKRRNRAYLLAGVGLIAAAVILNLLVNLNLTVYSDDYHYGTYFRKGITGFLRKTAAHYMGTNGRWFVHILIPIFLLADVRAFAVTAPLLTAGIFLLGATSQNRVMTRGKWLCVAGLGMLALLGCDIFYLRMSLYWLSAYFNYVFPLIFPLAVVVMMERSMERERPGWEKALLWVCAFLSGACTEQNAVIALVVIIGFWILQCRGQLRRQCVPPVLTALGFLTILLAPGSRARVERGIEGGLRSVLKPGVFPRRFFEVMEFLSGHWSWNILFAALCVIVGALCLTRKNTPRHLVSGLGAGVLTVLLAAAGLEKVLAVFTVLYALYMAVTLLFVEECRISGLMLLGGGASVMMLTVTTLFYARTFLPCILLFILVTVSSLFRLLDELPGLPGAAVCAALTALFVVRWAPVYSGYVANYQIVQRNLAAVEASRISADRDNAASESKEIILDMDLDWRYRFSMCFDGSYFLTNFRQYYQIPADAEIWFSSDEFQLSHLRAGEEVFAFPVLEKDGEVLAPFEFAMRGAGFDFTFNWSDYSYKIWQDGQEYHLDRHGNLTSAGNLIDSDCQLRRPYSDAYNLLFMRKEDLERCFGVKLTYDGQANEYAVE